MTSPHRHDDHTDSDPQRRRWPGRRRLPLVRWTATITAALGLALIAAGCGGGSNGPGVAGGGSNKTHAAASTGSASGSPIAQLYAFSRCMRRQGLADFPDPTTSGPGVGLALNGGPGSDLNRDNPRFKAAKQACQYLLKGGSQATQSVQKMYDEVHWARCMRSHGLPSFPDPNGQTGAFDRSKFDENSPAFQTASIACRSLRPAGPIPVH